MHLLEDDIGGHQLRDARGLDPGIRIALGEDLAARSEILITQRAMDRTTIDLDREPDRRRERISGIDIDYVCLDMAIRSR